MRRSSRTLNGRSTPSPPTSPPGPDHTHSDHKLNEEPLLDFDGPGRDEAEMVDSPIAVVVRERHSCRRDGCGVSGGHNHLYTLDALSDELRAAVEYASNNDYEEAEVEYVAMNATIVDHDEVPVLGVEFGDEVFGYVYPDESVSKGYLGGECNGQPLEPSYEPHGL